MVIAIHGLFSQRFCKVLLSLASVGIAISKVTSDVMPQMHILSSVITLQILSYSSGGLYDLVGFRWSTLFLVSCNGLLAVLSGVQLLASRRRSQHRAQYQEILGQDGEWNLKTHTRSISIRTIRSWIESDNKYQSQIYQWTCWNKS